MLEQRSEEIRIAFYTRISTDEDHQKYSLAAQADRLEAYSKAQYDRWILHEVYADTSSGTNMERPGLQAMLAGARQSAFDMVMVFRVDRLSRNVRQLSGMVEELMQIGVVLKSATEPFDTSNSAGKMMLQMLGVFAEFEHATIVERTKAGMQRKAKNGEWCGGGVAFGYQIDPGQGLRINEEESATVRIIYQLYTEQRLGGVAVSRHLNEKGYRRRNGGKWNNKVVLDLIRRPVYTGITRWSGIEQEGIHDAIIERGVWTQAQEILRKRSEDSMARLSNRSDYLLSGNIHCGGCGKPMVGCSGNKNGHKHTYYVCRGRLSYGKGDCGQDYVRADDLETAILDRIREVATDPDVFADIVTAANAKLGNERPNLQTSIKVVEARIGKVRVALERYFQAFEDGDMDSALCRERVQGLGAQLRQLEEERDGLQRQSAQAELGVAGGMPLQEFERQFDEVIKKGAPASQRKHLVKILVPRVVVYSREEIEVFFRAPVPSVRVTGVLAPRDGPRRSIFIVSTMPRALLFSEGRIRPPSWTVNNSSVR